MLTATSGADGQSTPPAATSETPTPAQTADLTPAEITLLNSGQPINVVMDPTTGDIESVTAASGSGAVPAITHRSGICDSGDGCYKTDQTPYANQGFYGSSGTSTGTWYDRSAYSSGNYTVSACWVSGCGIEIGAGSQVDLTSDVTGTSFTID
jgi:hypothetical protein